MTEIEKQIQDILDRYTNSDNDKRILEIELRLLVDLVERKQIEEDYKISLKAFEKTLETLRKNENISKFRH